MEIVPIFSPQSVLSSRLGLELIEWPTTFCLTVRYPNLTLLVATETIPLCPHLLHTNPKCFTNKTWRRCKEEPRRSSFPSNKDTSTRGFVYRVLFSTVKGDEG
ncbi:hypothetical protein L6452_19205 [Arctium lappa]|uniref:Uncharacterized protein n=1 Tax=Arctium lappa TaxID=4217 RepID=A0ACB9B821_ARCLA|nr:hypothetical protein L6452_19205 [Arctium lappa]